MSVAVVVAAFDERDNIRELALGLDAALADRRGARQLIFVVEGTDGTKEILEGLSASIPDLTILYRREPRGLGAAFRVGFAAVTPGVDLVATLDADLNHRPEELPALIAALESQGADIVVGSRDVAGSRAEGIPAWKRGLSLFVNRALSRLTGSSVLDKTSGYRLYRRPALAQLEIRSDGFSFLADLLLQAQAYGMKVAEVPIHFVYRQRGASKLPFLRTGFEYLALLARSVAPADRLLWLWLLIGVAYRLVVVFPLHRYPADGDSTLTALTALRILDGHAEIFFNGVRIGAVGCWITAGLFLLVGPTRLALALGPLLYSIATMAVLALTARELVGRERALWALPLVAIPLPMLTFWTYMPVAYGEIVGLAAWALWVCVRIVRRGATPGRLAELGLVTGLCLWTSALTACVVAPAFAWMLYRRPSRLRSGRAVAIFLVALAVASSPWWIANARSGFPTLRSDYHTRPVTSFGELAENLRFVALHRLPTAVAWTHPLRAYTRTARSHRVVAALLLAMTGIWIALAFRGLRRESENAGRQRDVVVLLAGVLVATVAANAISHAGSLRVETERYVLPVLLVFPLLAAAGRAAVTRRASRGALASSIALVAVISLLLTYGPWHPSRQRWIRELAESRRIVELLESRGVGAIAGAYSQVYEFNFLSRREVPGLPIESSWDAKGVGETLPPHPLRWGLLAAGPHELRVLSQCAARALPGGELLRIGRRRWLWIGPAGEASERSTSREQLARIRAACPRLVSSSFGQ